jgi:two-component system LytT family response regulator
MALASRILMIGDLKPMATQNVERTLKAAALGFAYWAAFLLVLEPENAMRAARAGHALSLQPEALRIAVAATLGTLVMPLLQFLTRRFPLWGLHRRQHVLVHLGSSAAIAFGLIVVSCLLAAWFLAGQLWPTMVALRDELVGNWLLLTYAMLALTGLLHVVAALHLTGERSATVHPRRRTHVSVKARGCVKLIAVSSVDWIETQGNYLALHVGVSAHLVRETAAKFEAQFDLSGFVRIHRGAIIAVDRIASVQRLGKGDAQVTLTTGEAIRASRRYREALWDTWTSHCARH